MAVRRPLPLLPRVVAVALVALGLPVLALQSPAAAAAWGVSDTSDTPVGQASAGFTNASLREAITSANANPGPDAILVASGTYTLANGPIQVSGDLTISRVGAGAVVIDGGGTGVFTLDDGTSVTLKFLSVTGADSAPAITAGAPGGGSNSLDVQSTSISGNAGGAIDFTGGDLTVERASGSLTGSTLSNNSSATGGGAIRYVDEGGGALDISNTTFSGNSSTSDGGAVSATGLATTSTVIDRSRFVGNSATTGTAGALFQRRGSLSLSRSDISDNSGTATGRAIRAIQLASATMHFNRFHGNGDPAVQSVILTYAGTPAPPIDLERNWWGCNEGPGNGGDCEQAGSDGAVAVDTEPWLVVGATAPTYVDGPNGTATITAAISEDSDGGAVAASNLVGFDGVTVGWSDPLPSPADLTASSSAMDDTATATVGYNSRSGAAGPGSVTATLDEASVTVSFTVRHRPQVTDDPDDVTVAPGAPVTFTAAASGTPTPTVQWRVSTDSGGTWDDLTGEESTTLAFTAAEADDGNRYRAVFTSAAGTDTTDAATLTVGTAPSFVGVDSTTFVVGDPGTFVVATSDGGHPSVITASGTLPTGVTFTDNGDGTATLAGTPAAGTAGDYPLDLSADNGIGTAGSQSFTLKVHEPPAVTDDPDDAEVGEGDTATFTVTGTGTPTPDIQWQVSTDDGGTWNDLTGEESATLSITAALTDDGNRYRAVLSNDEGDATSGDALLTVVASPVFLSATGTTFTAGVPGTFVVSASTGGRTTTISESGALPAGVTLTDNGDGTATLAGTPGPGTAGDHPITLTADNGFGTDTQPFVLHVAAPPATPSTITITAFPVVVVYGQEVRATATVTAANAGAVQFAVDGTDVGGPVPLVAGTATSPALPVLEPGEHQVTARFAPADPAAFTSAFDSRALTIQRAPTAVTPAVHPRSVTAAVTTAVGKPGGTVEFSVDGVALGTAAVVDGVATLAETVSSGGLRHVTASYSGDSRFTPSTGAVDRDDPSISATTVRGWSRTPVRVAFTCAESGSPLLHPCPHATTIRHNGVRVVTRTIRAADGGTAAVGVTVRIDKIAPRVWVERSRGADHGLRCVARDWLSGVRSCRLTDFSRRAGVLHFTMTATDVAGNETVRRGSRSVR